MGWPAWLAWPISGATLDTGASPAVLAAASAGVIVRPVGTAVAMGAMASLNRGEDGSGVGGGIFADSKKRTGDAGWGAAAGPAASGSGEAKGVEAARDDESARGPTANDPGAASGVEAARGADAARGGDAASCDGSTACGVDSTPAAGFGVARFRPHDWQLVCPRKTSVAPQNRQVWFCDPCPSVTLYLTSGQAPNCRALVARQYDHAKRWKDRPLGPY